jgi:hypothetical protein
MAEAEKACSLSEGLRGITLGRVHAILGNQAEAREILNEIKQASNSRYLSRAAHCAMIHAVLGEPDEAFEWLGRAFGEREPTLIYLSQAPDFEGLHDDPRFRDLVRRIGLAA